MTALQVPVATAQVQRYESYNLAYTRIDCSARKHYKLVAYGIMEHALAQLP